MPLLPKLPPIVTHCALCILALCILALCACNGDEAPEDASHKVDSKRDAAFEVWSFRANFPGATTKRTQQVTTPVGVLAQSSEVFEDKRGAFSVTWADYPESYIRSVADDVVLQGAVDGAARGVRGVVRDHVHTRFEGHPAREFSVVAPRGLRYKARVALAGRRLFQFIVTTNEEGLADPRVRRFFESVHLARDT